MLIFCNRHKFSLKCSEVASKNLSTGENMSPELITSSGVFVIQIQPVRNDDSKLSFQAFALGADLFFQFWQNTYDIIIILPIICTPPLAFRTLYPFNNIFLLSSSLTNSLKPKRSLRLQVKRKTVTSGRVAWN